MPRPSTRSRHLQLEGLAEFKSSWLLLRTRPLRLCLAKLYARTGIPDLSLHYLKKAKEEGYRDFKDVYKDSEFASLAQGPSLRCTDGCENDGHLGLTGCASCAETQRIPRRIAETNLSRART